MKLEARDLVKLVNGLADVTFCFLNATGGLLDSLSGSGQAGRLAQPFSIMGYVQVTWTKSKGDLFLSCFVLRVGKKKRERSFIFFLCFFEKELEGGLGFLRKGFRTLMD